jgi:hypothetical protein
MMLFKRLLVIGSALRPSKVLDVTTYRQQKLGRRERYRDGCEYFDRNPSASQNSKAMLVDSGQDPCFGCPNPNKRHEATECISF